MKHKVLKELARILEAKKNAEQQRFQVLKKSQTERLEEAERLKENAFSATAQSAGGQSAHMLKNAAIYGDTMLKRARANVSAARYLDPSVDEQRRKLRHAVQKQRAADDLADAAAVAERKEKIDKEEVALEGLRLQKAANKITR